MAHVSVKFRGKEVRNPVLRKLIVAWMFLVLAVVIVVLIILSPLLVTMHFALRVLGRRGFTRWDSPTTFRIKVDRDGFRRA